ncbi:hypothetical protein CRG98_005742 [Punica granatum]|uniref:Uncharacterized protein n=1 Tax=Punica granatum TaxID=22663 RepID=A0A2I0KZJ5_PUNGR|nr:hypothetical protein CRG98_005742 [Punica granatum]
MSRDHRIQINLSDPENRREAAASCWLSLCKSYCLRAMGMGRLYVRMPRGGESSTVTWTTTLCSALEPRSFPRSRAWGSHVCDFLGLLYDFSRAMYLDVVEAWFSVRGP